MEERQAHSVRIRQRDSSNGNTEQLSHFVRSAFVVPGEDDDGIPALFVHDIHRLALIDVFVARRRPLEIFKLARRVAGLPPHAAALPPVRVRLVVGVLDVDLHIGVLSAEDVSGVA